MCSTHVSTFIAWWHLCSGMPDNRSRHGSSDTGSEVYGEREREGETDTSIETGMGISTSPPGDHRKLLFPDPFFVCSAVGLDFQVFFFFPFSPNVRFTRTSRVPARHRCFCRCCFLVVWGREEMSKLSVERNVALQQREEVVCRDLEVLTGFESTTSASGPRRRSCRSPAPRRCPSERGGELKRGRTAQRLSGAP